MSTAGSVSPAVLKNRGVPMTVHTVVRDADGRPTSERAVDDAGEFIMEKSPRWIRFDNNILSDIEDENLGWGSVDKWEEALVAAPFGTVRATLAMCWGFDPTSKDDLRVVGAICPDATEETGTLIGAAYMLANGMDPVLVGEAIRQSEGELVTSNKAKQARLAEALKAATTTEAQDVSPTSLSEPIPTGDSPPGSGATPGTSGSEPGSSSADVILTSSGV